MTLKATIRKNRWNKKTYIRYGITVNRVTEADLIEYILKRNAAGDSTNKVFKDAVRREMENDQND